MYIFLLITIFFTLLTNVTSNIFEAWSTNKILERDGYNRETHNITTEDGFILSLHRIPGKVNSTPVLLMHGLLCDSTIWIILGKNKSLAYLLADKGYDVWLGNSRGSTYGMSHVNLTTRDFKFWDFSFNEMGVYDLPATINYITNITKQKVIVIGHSQGTRINFIMESERPEITEKVKALICLAPVAFLRHVEPHVQKFSFFLAQFLNSTLQPILSNFPAGTSSKNIRHFLQGITSQTFSKYDYGETKNLEIYNSSKPPEYNLSRVTSPVALIYSEGDWYTDPMDVDALSEQLPNVVDKYKVSYQKFSHMDFLWAKDAKSLVYDHVIELVKNFTDS
ncbi:lipase 1-like isoform X2 [Microplitis mediator]|uniref:lipase 1-like isoform X2 n=1 Tax=Microplitis mediator TaxID=375433 RepID=UPI002552D926|nr:lipase 1-like isoform X2 [Microplitis mediator]